MRRVFLTAFAGAFLMAGSAVSQQTDPTTLTAVGSADHGAYVVGPDGRPVYAFLTSAEIGGDDLDPLESCQVNCRDNWPLVIVDGPPRVGDGLDQDLAGSLEADGETVATYGDHPLFQFHRDVPGEEPVGQGIYSFGGYWALLTPSGRPIMTGPMEKFDEMTSESESETESE